MTIGEAITRIDLQKQNTCTRQEKLDWLSELDGLLRTQVLSPQDPRLPVQLPYEDPVADTAELLAPPPYDGMYLWWLEARIDYQNGEFIRFNNAMELFRAMFRDHAAWYNRTRMTDGGTEFF